MPEIFTPSPSTRPLPTEVEVRAAENMKVGDTVSFRHVFYQEDLDAFVRLSGDINQLHQDDAYAQALGFSKRIVFGLLSASLVSRLVGVHLPGHHSLIRDVQVQFPNPLYVGEEVEVTGQVDILDLPKRLLGVKVRVVRCSDGAKILRGKVMVSLASASDNWRTGAREGNA